jgi:hypothetical protein
VPAGIPQSYAAFATPLDVLFWQSCGAVNGAVGGREGFRMQHLISTLADGRSTCGRGAATWITPVGTTC